MRFVKNSGDLQHHRPVAIGRDPRPEYRDANRLDLRPGAHAESRSALMAEVEFVKQTRLMPEQVSRMRTILAGLREEQ